MAHESMVEVMESSPHSLITIQGDDLHIKTGLVNDDEDDGQSAAIKVGDSVSKSFSRNTSSSRLNAGAPEFVPRSNANSSISNSNHHHHHQAASATPRLVLMQHAAPHHFPVPHPPLSSPMFHVPSYPTYGVGRGSFPLKHQEPDPPESLPLPLSLPADSSDQHQSVVHPSQQPITKSATGGLSDEVRHKILNQVEYYFSDANLATTDHLIKYMSKDPDGFVPLSVVASFKKIKAIVNSPHQLAAVLRKSTKLIVSDDGKKIRRQHPFTESDMEELQSRMVVAENLPEDHSYQSLMRIFSGVGSVKTIRTCQPQNCNNNNNNGGGGVASSRMDNMLFSNKMHAFVEYESVELAEKAVSELNDERNWRSGLRLRLLLPKQQQQQQQQQQQRTSRAATRRKYKQQEGDGGGEEEDLVSTSEQQQHLEDATQQEHTNNNNNSSMEDNDKESSSSGRRGGRGGGGRGRGKGRGRGGQHHNNNNINSSNRGNNVLPATASSYNNEHSLAIGGVSKQPPGPRMPDGTRGFAMGRGKPAIVVVATTTSS